MNIKEALEYGINKLKENQISEPVLKSRLLMANVLNISKEYIIVHESDALDDLVIEKYKEGINRLCKNTPIQYIINKQEFMGIDFYVDENVLIPQPDTEILVEEVISIINNNIEKGFNRSDFKVLDLCTGSGAIGISIAKKVDNLKVTLSDISRNALNVAKTNCIRIISNKEIEFIESDLFENIDDRFDIIVSNPPYIKTKEIKSLSKEVQNEPVLALDGGEDGLRVYKKIIDKAYKFLNKNGFLCLEIGYDQKNEVIDLIKNNTNYENIYSKKDLSGNDRVIICKI